MTAPKVVLVMIVRDEAPIIGEQLKRWAPEVDAAVVVDTGSVDDTFDIVADTCIACGIEYHVSKHPWAGFADARNEALRQAHAWADDDDDDEALWYALLLDADTVAGFSPGWRACLTSDVIEVDVVHGPLRYAHPRLVRLPTKARFRGVLHEYLEVPFGARVTSTALLSIEHGHGGARERNPDKYRRDAELLRSAVDALALHPDDADADLLPRYAFYEAQSWRDAGYAEMAVRAYLARAGMGGWVDEVYVSLLRAGEIMWAVDQSALGRESTTGVWLRAHAADPTRAECLIGLATIYREAQMWAPAWLFAWRAYVTVSQHGARGLFADLNVTWRADFELSVAGWYTGHGYEGRRACQRLLARKDLDPGVRDRTQANLALYANQ